MLDWLRTAATHSGSQPFLLLADGTTETYDEVEHTVQLVVGSLIQSGVGPGDRVAIAPSNDPISIARLFAIPRVGAAAVVINRRLTKPEIAAQIERADVVAAFGSLGDATSVSGITDPDTQCQIEPDRDHTIIFTSGTSGAPKPVRLTWHNLEASAAASAAHLRHTSDDRWYTALPIHHIGGLSIMYRTARERSVAALETSFDPTRAASMMLDGDVTLASMVSAMLRSMLEIEPGPYRGVRAVLVGGGPIPRELLGEAIEAGLPVLPTYGMTETASQVATRPLRDALHPGTSAEPLPGAEIRTDRLGRIEVRGPMVSPGYLGEPGRDQEWFRTSDVGRFVDGRLEVLGRADDVIITGGENVHPAEVESVLADVAGVIDVAVIGVAHPRWGQEIVAVVEGTAAVGALERHARYHLAGFKIPKRWIVVASLPRLSIGKVDRRAIRSLAIEMIGATDT